MGARCAVAPETSIRHTSIQAPATQKTFTVSPTPALENTSHLDPKSRSSPF